MDIGMKSSDQKNMSVVITCYFFVYDPLWIGTVQGRNIHPLIGNHLKSKNWSVLQLWAVNEVSVKENTVSTECQNTVMNYKRKMI